MNSYSLCKLYRLLPLVALTLLLVAGATAQDLLNLNFKGHYRDKPKTSIVRRTTTGAISTPTHYSDVGNLLVALPKDTAMRHKYPDLNQGQTGFPETRETEELRNVEVDCWIYAIKFEDGRGTQKGDNDFHVILGNSADPTHAKFMTAEISGLPASGKNRAPLKAARQKFLQMFQGTSFVSQFAKISPPKKVTIKGSLFFDGDHQAGCPTCPGPSWAKPKSVWEIHPVYDIAEAT